jgi:hypothetical protein
LEVQGESICKGKDGQGCGYVFDSNIVHLGAEKRIFEGEDDLNHSGPAANPLLSDAYNMRTSMVMFNDKGKSKLNKLKRIQQTVEFNINDLEHDDGRTKEDTRDRQKAKVFDRMEVISVNIHIHYIAVRRAKEIFALYRKIRENLHDFDATIHACLVMGYEDVGIHLLAEEEGMEQDRLIDEAIQRRQKEEDSTAAPVPNAIRASDVALDTVPMIALGQFNSEQVHLWLEAVGNSAVSEQQDNSSFNRELVAQMIRVIEHLVSEKCLDISTRNGSSSGLSREKKNEKQAQIAELAKGLFGSTMAGRKRLLSTNGTGLAQNKSSNAGAAPEIVPGQALLTLSFFDVTRFIRRLKHQMSMSSEDRVGTDTMQTDDIDEEDDDQSQSMVSTSLSNGREKSDIPAEIIAKINGASASLILEWNEELMTAYETYFRQALNRRVRFDSRRKELEIEKRQEAHRLFVEQQPSSLSAIIHQKKSTTESGAALNKSIPSTDESTSSVSAGDNATAVCMAIDDLEDFFGGPIAVVRTAMSSGAEPVPTSTASAATAPVVVKNESSKISDGDKANVKQASLKPVSSARDASSGNPPAKKPRFIIK